MADSWELMLAETASIRRKHHNTIILQRETQKMDYLFCEEMGDEVPYPLTENYNFLHGNYHIPFKTTKYQEWV